MKTKFRCKMMAIFSMMLVMLIMAIPTVQAATNTESGVVITVTTDKQEYQADEKIQATVSLKNKNNVPAENVSLECVIPDGYTAEGETTFSAESLDADGAEATLEFTLVPANGAADNTATSEPAGTDAADSGNSTVWVVVAIIAVVIVVVIILTLKKGGKNKVAMFSLVLGGALLMSALPMNALKVDAEAKEYTVSAAEVVKVAGAEISIEATAVYSLDKVDLNELLNVKEFDEENAIIYEAEDYKEAVSITPYVKEGYEGAALKCLGGPTLITWDVTIEKDGTYQFTTVGTGMQSNPAKPVVGNLYINDELVVEGTLNTNEKYNPWDNPLRSRLYSAELTAGTYKVTFETYLGEYIIDYLAVEPKLAQ